MPPLARIALLTALAAVPLSAGDAAAQAQTGTDQGPRTTATAPYTSSVGRTKPPGGAAGPERSEDARPLTREERADDGVQKGICIGCSPK